MGNKTSNNFTNLEEVHSPHSFWSMTTDTKEKSLFSFEVKLVKISVENESKKEEKNIKNSNRMKPFAQ